MDKKKLELNEEQLDRVAGGGTHIQWVNPNDFISWECDECGAVHNENWYTSDKICKTCGFRNDIVSTYDPGNRCPKCQNIMDVFQGWYGKTVHHCNNCGHQIELGSN